MSKAVFKASVQLPPSIPFVHYLKPGVIVS